MQTAVASTPAFPAANGDSECEVSDVADVQDEADEDSDVDDNDSVFNAFPLDLASDVYGKDPDFRNTDDSTVSEDQEVDHDLLLEYDCAFWSKMHLLYAPPILRCWCCFEVVALQQCSEPVRPEHEDANDFRLHHLPEKRAIMKRLFENRFKSPEDAAAFEQAVIQMTKDGYLYATEDSVQMTQRQVKHGC